MTRVSYSAFSWMRPVYSLKQGDTVITMTFDRLGRRVDYQETRDGQVATHFRFVYDNFLCVQRLNAANGNAVRSEFVWDPTEPIATRPLVMRAKNWGPPTTTTPPSAPSPRNMSNEKCTEGRVSGGMMCH